MALIQCPECNREVSDKAEVCIHCGYPIKEYINKDKYEIAMKQECPDCNAVDWEMHKSSGRIFCNKCHKNIILDKEVYDEFMKQARIKRQQEANKPKCPRCGSTEVQIVRKNWSIWSGFRTNDTERVCVKCKKKW